MAAVPLLELTHGQLLWAIALGRDPGAEVRDKARYLRQLGIPRPPGEGPGKGQRTIYGFDDLALLGFGLLALGEGYKPRVLVDYLVGQRARILADMRDLWSEFPDEFVDGPWTKMRGRMQPVRAEPGLLRLHGRGRGQMAAIEIVRGDGSESSPFMTLSEIIPGQAPAKVFVIDYWLPQWVAWAREAPPQPRGRQIIEPS